MKQSSIPRWVTYATLIFLYLPIVVMAIFSFNESRYPGVWTGFSLRWYYALWEAKRVWMALQNSLIIGITATFAATVLGTLAAVALHFFRSWLQRFHYTMIYFPLVIPDIVVGMSLLMLFVSFGVHLGLGTIFVAHTTFCISYVALLVLSRLQNFDQRVIEAAQDLGAGWVTICFRVLLPMLLPGISAGALMAFTMSIDDFVITYFVSGPGSTTLPIYIYSMTKFGATPIINALSTIILLGTILIFLLAQRMNRGGEAS